MARVLVVEDLRWWSLILAESVIEEMGHETYSAASVTEASKLLDDPGGMNAVFTDIRLPEDS